MVSPTVQSSNINKSSSSSTNPKEQSIVNDKMTTKIKIEDGTDEIKVFAASTIDNNESDNDQNDDVDIEDRLSPVVEEPVKHHYKLNKLLVNIL